MENIGLVDKAIILIEVAGTWNIETSNVCIDIIKDLLDTYQVASFAILVDSEKMEGVTS
jgi:hypothetical protein